MYSLSLKSSVLRFRFFFVRMPPPRKIKLVYHFLCWARFAKVVWKPVQNSAPELFTFLESFSLSYRDYTALLTMYNEVKRPQLQDPDPHNFSGSGFVSKIGLDPDPYQIIRIRIVQFLTWIRICFKVTSGSGSGSVNYFFSILDPDPHKKILIRITDDKVQYKYN